MAVKLITYDLNSPGQDYQALYKCIQAQGAWLHLLDSTWLVVTSKSTKEVCDAIRVGADESDHFFVVDVSGDPRSGWLPKSKWDWIDANL